MLSVVPPVAFSAPLLAQAVFWYSAGGLALISFIGVFWVRIVRPLDHAVTALRQFVPALPGLIELQAEFKSNGGSSLRDRVDYIANEAEAAKEMAAATSRKQIELAQRIEESTLLLTQQLQEFRSHLVEINHTEIAMLAAQSAQLDVTPLHPASERAIVPHESGDEPPA